KRPAFAKLISHLLFTATEVFVLIKGLYLDGRRGVSLLGRDADFLARLQVFKLARFVVDHDLGIVSQRMAMLFSVLVFHDQLDCRSADDRPLMGVATVFLSERWHAHK